MIWWEIPGDISLMAILIHFHVKQISNSNSFPDIHHHYQSLEKPLIQKLQTSLITVDSKVDI